VTVKVKVCCIQSYREARLAIAQGASAIGLVSDMPSGPGVIPEEKIAEIETSIPSHIGSFLLTSLQEPNDIVAQHRGCKTHTIQLCNRIDLRSYVRLRRELPETSLVQVIHVTGENAIAEAEWIAPHVDALLLDSGDPTADPKSLGGTGKRHDWKMSRRIRDSVPKPVFLAGGLSPSNVIEAIRAVQPFGVDVCTGVRSDDSLDEMKLSAFFAAITAAG